MAETPRAYFSHVGFHVRDLELMAAFYSDLVGLEVTDRGTLHVLPAAPAIEPRCPPLRLAQPDPSGRSPETPL